MHFKEQLNMNLKLLLFSHQENCNFYDNSNKTGHGVTNEFPVVEMAHSLFLFKTLNTIQ